MQPEILYQATKMVGRHVGSGTTFERSASYWRDGEEVIGVARGKIEQIHALVKTPAFAACTSHTNSDVRDLAEAISDFAQKHRKRGLRWRIRDLLASSEATVPVPRLDLGLIREKERKLWPEHS